MLLTKEKYLFSYMLNLYFNDLCFYDFTLYFNFWICAVNRSWKFAATSTIWPQIFLGKTTNAPIFSIVDRK